MNTPTTTNVDQDIYKNILSVGPDALLKNLTFTRSKCVDSAILKEVEDMIFELIVQENQMDIVTKTLYEASFNVFMQAKQAAKRTQIQINGH